MHFSSIGSIFAGFGHFDRPFRGLCVHVCVCEGQKFANRNGQNLLIYFRMIILGGPHKT